ncbi:Tryptophan--tRNA ligase, mitochondrial [Apophysomyces sp. BC1034]|nr:Tryptophan--tRNA ligase, mitochondrial [Apophysomyces sp. BC1015]KAG0181005.1 Tryptophan--tRNA ligase, mitochondrial [Apophysomyces sp. BC1021]KAG0192586.1 Tryptophan--tRNA ligase, mitochondrial [Apophysomyces sp. BC1034]
MTFTAEILSEYCQELLKTGSSRKSGLALCRIVTDIVNKMFKRTLTSVAKPRVILSGIQPTGTPHLGNYLGALANWTKLQEPDPLTKQTATNYYSIVDLHAITMPQDPATLRKAKLDMAIGLLACGVDPKRSVLFEQSRVRGHAELAWIFNCITPVGWLGRMTQWKSKMGGSEGKILSHAQILADESITAGLKMGLFDYPVLQAADIMLYRATHVPVGEDQLQHLELARDIASTFNHTFKADVFPKPDAIVPPATKRVMSLREPTNKMSKSDKSDYARINLTDSPDVIRSKIGRAMTDSTRGVTYDPKERPGVSNLVGIYAAVRDINVEQALQELGDIQSTKVFKDQVAEAVITKLQPIQSELVRLTADVGYVKDVLDQGAQKAEEIASKTMDDVYKVVGLR